MSGAFSAIAGGIPIVSNLLGSFQKQRYLNDQLKYQKYLRSLATDPAKMSAYVSGFEKPLDAGLIKSVNNQVQAFGAERGLSTSPQLMAEIESQALGPLVQQNKQVAINEALASLGLPSGDPSAMLSSQQPLDLTSLMKTLLPAASEVIPFSPVGGSVIYPDGQPSDSSGGGMPPLTVPGGDSMDLGGLIDLLFGAGGTPSFAGAS